MQAVYMQNMLLLPQTHTHTRATSVFVRYILGLSIKMKHFQIPGSLFL